MCASSSSPATSAKQVLASAGVPGGSPSHGGSLCLSRDTACPQEPAAVTPQLRTVKCDG